MLYQATIAVAGTAKNVDKLFHSFDNYFENST
jgi:hypothetical protein